MQMHYLNSNWLKASQNIYHYCPEIIKNTWVKKSVYLLKELKYLHFLHLDTITLLWVVDLKILYKWFEITPKSLFSFDLYWL